MATAERRIGQVLAGKYRVQELLATGGMGVVYAARHEQTGRSLAVKLLRPELAACRDLAERLSREARLAVEASHPNVVQVLDAGADDAGIPYLVLERLYGSPLEALLERPLSLRSAMQALVPVINALATLHQAGIVHRDLKPSNIFLSRERNGRVTPKLLDFGIAKALEGVGVTRTGAALGTPAYMAPEQVLGCSEISPASDIWSIAVVCVRCLTGRLPFDGAPGGARALYTGVSRCDLHDLPGVPEPLGPLLCSALRWEPAARPQTAQEFRRQLFAALQHVDAGARWPSESTVSLDPESELARSVATAGPEAPGTGAFGFARPAHVLTRTLSRAWQSVSVRARLHALRRPWLAVLAAGVLGSFVQGEAPTVPGLAPPGREGSTPSETLQQHPVLASSAPPLERVQASAGLGFPEPTAGVPASASGRSLPARSTRRALPKQSPVEAPREAANVTADLARAAAEPPRASADSAGSVAESAAARTLIGANRSPIIE